MNNLFKKIKRYFKNLFSNRKLEWQSQLDFIIALAKANDIPFNPTVFPKPKRPFKNGNIVWEQSQAAEYISDKINEKEMLGEYIFKPWNTAWLKDQINGKQKMAKYGYSFSQKPKDRNFGLIQKQHYAGLYARIACSSGSTIH